MRWDFEECRVVFRDSKPPINVQHRSQSVEAVADCLWANPPYSFAYPPYRTSEA